MELEGNCEVILEYSRIMLHAHTHPSCLPSSLPPSSYSSSKSRLRGHSHRERGQHAVCLRLDRLVGRPHADRPLARRTFLARRRVDFVAEDRHRSSLGAAEASTGGDARVVVEGQPRPFVEAAPHVAVDIVPVVIPLHSVRHVQLATSIRMFCVQFSAQIRGQLQCNAICLQLTKVGS